MCTSCNRIIATTAWLIASYVPMSAGTLFVNIDNTLATYDSNSGALLNSAFVTFAPNVAHRAAGIAVSSTGVYVARSLFNDVCRFDLTTGATLASPLLTTPAAPAFSTQYYGLSDGIQTLTIGGPSNTLTVAIKNPYGNLAEYNATTGSGGAVSKGGYGTTTAWMNANGDTYVNGTSGGIAYLYKYGAGGTNSSDILGTGGVASNYTAITGDSSDTIYAGRGTQISKRTTTGSVTLDFITLPGTENALGLVTDDSGHLFVSSNSKVLKYDATTGALLDANFITGTNNAAIAFTSIPEPSGWILSIGASGLAVGLIRHRRSNRRPHR